MLEYVLITPARNEEAFIETTIRSVINQTVLPKKWIIVSDGSTDRTDEIVRRYAEQVNWIELMRMPDREGRSYTGKATCFNAAYEKIKKVKYEVIGNIDADISFDRDQLEFLLGKFAEIPDLGVAGTRYREDDLQDSIYSYKDVAGQCQLFRRECFEEMGGYTPSKYGGVDWIAVRTARMNGWKTMTFDEKIFYHHRIMSSAMSNKWIARIKDGRKDYFLGNHPLWEILRIGFQMVRKPYVINGLLLMYGYIEAFIRRMERPISKELLEFHRKEQLQRLLSIIKELPKLRIKINET